MLARRCAYCRTAAPECFPESDGFNNFALFDMIDCGHKVCQPCALIFTDAAGFTIECPSCGLVSALSDTSCITEKAQRATKVDQCCSLKKSYSEDLASPCTPSVSNSVTSSRCSSSAPNGPKASKTLGRKGFHRQTKKKEPSQLGNSLPPLPPMPQRDTDGPTKVRKEEPKQPAKTSPERSDDELVHTVKLYRLDSVVETRKSTADATPGSCSTPVTPNMANHGGEGGNESQDIVPQEQNVRPQVNQREALILPVNETQTSNRGLSTPSGSSLQGDPASCHSAPVHQLQSSEGDTGSKRNKGINKDAKERMRAPTQVDSPVSSPKAPHTNYQRNDLSVEATTATPGELRASDLMMPNAKKVGNDVKQKPTHTSPSGPHITCRSCLELCGEFAIACEKCMLVLCGSCNNHPDHCSRHNSCKTSCNLSQLDGIVEVSPFSSVNVSFRRRPWLWQVLSPDCDICKKVGSHIELCKKLVVCGSCRSESAVELLDGLRKIFRNRTEWISAQSDIIQDISDVVKDVESSIRDMHWTTRYEQELRQMVATRKAKSMVLSDAECRAIRQVINRAEEQKKQLREIKADVTRKQRDITALTEQVEETLEKFKLLSMGSIEPVSVVKVVPECIQLMVRLGYVPAEDDESLRAWFVTVPLTFTFEEIWFSAARSKPVALRHGDLTAHPPKLNLKRWEMILSFVRESENPVAQVNSPSPRFPSRSPSPYSRTLSKVSRTNSSSSAQARGNDVSSTSENFLRMHSRGSESIEIGESNGLATPTSPVSPRRMQQPFVRGKNPTSKSVLQRLERDVFSMHTSTTQNESVSSSASRSEAVRNVYPVHQHRNSAGKNKLNGSMHTGRHTLFSDHSAWVYGEESGASSAARVTDRSPTPRGRTNSTEPTTNWRSHSKPRRDEMQDEMLYGEGDVSRFTRVPAPPLRAPYRKRSSNTFEHSMSDTSLQLSGASSSRQHSSASRLRGRDTEQKPQWSIKQPHTLISTGRGSIA